MANGEEGLALWLTARGVVLAIVYIVSLCLIVELWQGPDYYFTYVAITANLTQGTFQVVQNESQEQALGLSRPDFYGITTVSHIYKWLETQITPVFARDWPRLLIINYLLGQVRLRQLRVGNHTCDHIPLFETAFGECYGEYTEAKEDKGKFGLQDGTAWVWNSPEQLRGSRFGGRFAKYGGGGYYVDLPNDQDKSKELIRELERNRWLDEGTRVFFVELNFYNPSLNLFTIVKLYIEFPHTGGCVPESFVQAMKLLPDETTYAYIAQALRMNVVMTALFTALQQAVELQYWGARKYFSVKSHYAEIALVVTAISLDFVGFYKSFKQVDIAVEALESHAYRELLGAQVEFDVRRYTALLALVFGWLRLMRLCDFGKHSMLNSTLHRALPDLASFCFMFGILLCGFAMLGYMLFGSDLPEFRNFEMALFVLLQVIIGNLDYQSLANSSRILGPLYYMLFIFLVVFVLFNMFIVILNNTYFDVREEALRQPAMFDVIPFLSHCFKNLRTFLKLPVREERIIEQPLPLRSLRTMFHMCRVHRAEVSDFIFALTNNGKLKYAGRKETEELAKKLEARLHWGLTEEAVDWDRFTRLWRKLRDLEFDAHALDKSLDELLAVKGFEDEY